MSLYIITSTYIRSRRVENSYESAETGFENLIYKNVEHISNAEYLENRRQIVSLKSFAIADDEINARS